MDWNTLHMLNLDPLEQNNHTNYHHMDNNIDLLFFYIHMCLNLFFHSKTLMHYIDIFFPMMNHNINIVLYHNLHQLNMYHCINLDLYTKIYSIFIFDWNFSLKIITITPFQFNEALHWHWSWISPLLQIHHIKQIFRFFYLQLP